MRNLILAATTVLALAASANAETAYGITGAVNGTNLVRFDTSTPAVFNLNTALTGVASGYSIKAIDFRPADGRLYALATGTNSTAAPTVALNLAQLYTINLATGAATTVGTGFTLGTTVSGRMSIDFNPVVDRLRVVTGDNQNFRVNPITGALAATDTNLTYDPAALPAGFVAGDVPLVAGVAYTNNVVGATSTTLYGYDYAYDNLVTIGSVGGTPNSPNGGLVATIGTNPTVFLTTAASIGMDISGATGIAYLQADTGTQSALDRLSTINLANGTETLLGSFTTNMLDISIVVPEPTSLGLVAAGGLFLRRRRA